MTEVKNPMLDDDDEILEAANPMLEDDDESTRITARVNPYKPVRTPEAQAEVDRKKAAGLVSDGKKKREKRPHYKRSRLTEKDAALLAFLVKFRYATTEQLGMLLTVDDPKHENYGKLAAEATVRRRLYGLLEAGAVDQLRLIGIAPLWRVTELGVMNAIVREAITEREIDPNYRKLPTLSEVPHTLGVNQVAAMFASPGNEWGTTLKNLVSEHMIRSAKEKVDWKVDPESYHASQSTFLGLRENAMDAAKREILQDKMAWNDLLAENPEFWTIGMPSDFKNEAKAHHFPDLVVSFEHQRGDEKAVSWAIEVERSPKTKKDYAKMMGMWIHEWNKGSVYRQLYYFTNSMEVKLSIMSGDGGKSALEAKRLIFKDILHRNGKPMDMSGLAR